MGSLPEALDFDVVVVGCGISGLAAAASALQSGARVALLERAPREERGGNTRWTEAMLRMKSEHAVADDFENHFAENAGHYLDPALVNEAAGDYENWSSIVKVLGFTDPEVIATFAQCAGPTLQWLKGFGLRFDFLPGYFITTCTTRMAPVGGGLALVETLGDWVEKGGAKVFYRTTAQRLVRDASGAVIGLGAVGPGNAAREFRAPAIVLASGGFEGNPEMLVRYLGPRARYLRPVAAAATTTRARASAWRSMSEQRLAAISAASTPSRSTLARVSPSRSCSCSITASSSTSGASAS